MGTFLLLFLAFVCLSNHSIFFLLHVFLSSLAKQNEELAPLMDLHLVCPSCFFLRRGDYNNNINITISILHISFIVMYLFSLPFIRTAIHQLLTASSFS